MAKVPLITALRPNTLLATADRYIPVAGTSDGTETTEANIEFKVKESATLSDLWAYVDVVSSANISLQLRKNNSDGNLNVSLNSVGAVEDTSNTDSVVNNDDISYQYDRAAGRAGPSMVRVMYESASGDLVVPCVSNSPGGLGIGTTNRYPAVMGEVTGIVSESPLNQREISYNATWHNLAFYTPSNSKSIGVPVKSRINGADGNQNLTVPSSTSGYFEDTSNTDDLAPGDLINYVVEIGGVGIITFSTIASLITYDTTTGMSMWSDSRANSTRTGSATTHFFPLIGGNNGWASNTDEAAAQVKAGLSGTLKNFTAYTNSVNYTANATARIRINGADGNQSITLVAGDPNSQYVDTSNTDDIVPTDLVCVSVTGGTSGKCNHRGWGIDFEYATGTTRRIFVVS